MIGDFLDHFVDCRYDENDNYHRLTSGASVSNRWRSCLSQSTVYLSTLLIRTLVARHTRRRAHLSSRSWVQTWIGLSMGRLSVGGLANLLTKYYTFLSVLTLNKCR